MTMENHLILNRRYIWLVLHCHLGFLGCIFLFGNLNSGGLISRSLKNLRQIGNKV